MVADIPVFDPYDPNKAWPKPGSGTFTKDSWELIKEQFQMWVSQYNVWRETRVAKAGYWKAKRDLDATVQTLYVTMNTAFARSVCCFSELGLGPTLRLTADAPLLLATLGKTKLR
jgi:hypothetical protein